MAENTRIRAFVRLMSKGETDKAEAIYRNPQFAEEFKAAKKAYADSIKKEEKVAEKPSKEESEASKEESKDGSK